MSYNQAGVVVLSVTTTVHVSVSPSGCACHFQLKGDPSRCTIRIQGTKKHTRSETSERLRWLSSARSALSYRESVFFRCSLLGIFEPFLLAVLVCLYFFRRFFFQGENILVAKLCLGLTLFTLIGEKTEERGDFRTNQAFACS